MFPPLNETSFSEQYKTFKALGARRQQNGMGNNLEMSKDLQMRIRPTAANKPYFKRNVKGPSFEHEGMGQPSNLGMMGPPVIAGNQSVFQTNASHVLASPNTFNMMADITTAPDMQQYASRGADSQFNNSMMRNFMSPNGK